MNKQDIFDKFTEIMDTFAQLRVIVALRDGFVMTTPFTICGSFFLLIANIPIEGYQAFMESLFGSSWTVSINAVAGATFNILALIVVISITYRFVADEGCDASMAALLALSTFLILMPPNISTSNGEIITDIIPKAWTGSNGIITAIIVAFTVSYIFCYCEKKQFVVKMPDSVPISIVRAFEALIPAMILFTLSAIIHGICHFLGNITLPELIFNVIQTPLQGLSDTLLGGIIIAGLQCLLFWAGAHGPNIVSGVVNPILIANSLDNQYLIDTGSSLIGNPDAHIITVQIIDIFIKSGGCGLTAGLIIAGYFVSKSQQLKSIIKISLLPGLFNINEPIIFGLPIIFNPYLLLPFTLAPISAMIITYFSISIGFMSPCSAIQVPWTTPPIIAGFLLCGWQGALIQIINLIVATIIYLPFVKLQDKSFLEEEAANI